MIRTNMKLWCVTKKVVLIIYRPGYFIQAILHGKKAFEQNRIELSLQTGLTFVWH